MGQWWNIREPCVLPEKMEKSAETEMGIKYIKIDELYMFTEQRPKYKDLFKSLIIHILCVHRRHSGTLLSCRSSTFWKDLVCNSSSCERKKHENSWQVYIPCNGENGKPLCICVLMTKTNAITMFGTTECGYTVLDINTRQVGTPGGKLMHIEMHFLFGLTGY